MRHLMILLCVAAVAVTPVLAGSFTFTGPGTFGLQIVSDAPLLSTASGAAVSGVISLSPTEALANGQTSIFYLDNETKLVSGLSYPQLSLDTTKLSDGLHEVRMEVCDGTRLAFSTGAIPLHVLNDSTLNVIRQTPANELPFVKVYRKLIMREIVWFDNREADLEKHAFKSGGQIYITLTDLLRHVGGTIIWGPDQSYVMAERSGVKMQFVPGSSRIIINGQKRTLGQNTIRVDNRLCVPLRPLLRLMGITMEWNKVQGRAYINTH